MWSDIEITKRDILIERCREKIVKDRKNYLRMAKIEQKINENVHKKMDDIIICTKR